MLTGTKIPNLIEEDMAATVTIWVKEVMEVMEVMEDMEDMEDMETLDKMLNHIAAAEEDQALTDREQPDPL